MYFRGREGEDALTFTPAATPGEHKSAAAFELSKFSRASESSSETRSRLPVLPAGPVGVHLGTTGYSNSSFFFAILPPVLVVVVVVVFVVGIRSIPAGFLAEDPNPISCTFAASICAFLRHRGGDVERWKPFAATRWFLLRKILVTLRRRFSFHARDVVRGCFLTRVKDHRRRRRWL